MRTVQCLPKNPGVRDDGFCSAQRLGNRPLSTHLPSPGIREKVHAIP